MNIGLALGGGGARGLAHIVILEAFDELGIKPSIIAGTSIGALIGAAYASGMSALDIRTYCDDLLERRSAVLRHLYRRNRPFWRGLRLRGRSLFNAEKIISSFMPSSLPQLFEQLQCPLLTVSTDFYAQTAYVSSQGPLMPVLAASAALPALFSGVPHDDRILIDGGFVNPVPFDLLRNHADYIVAVDVSAGVANTKKAKPNMMNALIGSQLIALQTIIQEKLKTTPPDLFIKPNVAKFGVLDFFQKDGIMTAAMPCKDQLKTTLASLYSLNNK